MLLNQISLQQIIERKINFISTDPLYDHIDFKDYNYGEIKAYNKIKCDIGNMNEENFINKYLKILLKIDKNLKKMDNTKDKAKIEQISGYNNAIVFVLSLLNPKYEFDNIM